MTNEILNLNLKKIYTLIQENRINDAKKLLLKLKKLASLEIILNLDGMINLKEKFYNSSIKCFDKAISLNPNYISAYLNLFSAYNKINNFKQSEKIIRRALEIKPDSDIINNSLGYSLLKQEKNEESIYFFEKAINLNSKNFRAYFNLANAYFKKNKFNKAIEYFKKTLQINPTTPDTNFNLAECYKKIKDYQAALKYYEIASKEKNTWLRKDKITAKILETYLILEKKEEYIKTVLILSKKDPDNRRIAATTSYISHQFKVENQYPFCPDPLNFIYRSTLQDYMKDYKIFLSLIFEEITSLDFKWDPPGNTTRHGYRTTENISEKKLPNISKLENFILKEVNLYYQLHRHNKIKFIENWPLKFKFQSWSNRLKKQGHNITHIHPGGWVSGVFYLKIPKDIKNNEAGIEFSLHGDDYHLVDKNIPTKLLHPKEGDIILFPSSLFHRTIPFMSDQERVSIAFDLCQI